MKRQDVLVISQRYPLKTAVEALFGSHLSGQFRWERSPKDVLDSSLEPTDFLILDVLGLLEAEPTCIPQLVPPAPSILVVGFRDDSDALISAWNEGIPAWALEDLTADTLAQMTAQLESSFGFYEYLGQRTAERVHAYLTRRALARALTTQETAIVDLVRRGYTNARIAKQLGTEVKTVKNHLTHVYQKLGIARRYELLAWHFELPSGAYQPTGMACGGSR